MEIHEYNYKEKGYKKYLLTYKLDGFDKEFTVKEYAKTVYSAQKKVTKCFSNHKVEFVETYIAC